MDAPRPRITNASVLFSRQIDLRSSLATLGRAGDDLVDRFDGTLLVRSIRLRSDSPAVAYRALIPQDPADRLDVELAAGAADAAAHASAVGSTLVTATDELDGLMKVDARVGDLAARYPGLVPVLWLDPFTALVRSISAQQINLRWAATIRQRLALRYGRRLDVGDAFVYVLDASALADADPDELRALQFTNAKARAVVATARAATAGELRREDLEPLDDEQVIAHLTRLPGIGRWSAEWFLARTLGRPRVVAGDLGVRKAVGRLYDVGMPSEDDVRRLTAHWGGAASVAQVLALHDLAVRG